MTRDLPPPPGTKPAGVSDFPITVLLVDDQAIIGEAVRRMLADAPEVTLHFCQDPTQAIDIANRIRPTVILQDLVMPDLDGLTLVKFLRANPATRETPMIVLSSKEEPVVKAEAFALGANDYLVKLPDKIELLARIRYHSKGYIGLLQRNEAYDALRESQKRLADQIAAGVRFVRSLLPEPIADPLRVDWRYVPCADLGGDSFGYHWIDREHFAIYLIDVSGHGLDSALLSVSIMNVLRSKSLPDTDFREPGQVLAALNRAFPMESYDDKFFTVWYGVYRRPAAELAWANGGHPPALFYSGDATPGAEPLLLSNGDPLMGLFAEAEYETQRLSVPAQSRLCIYSDGVHEIHLPDGEEWTFSDFLGFLSQPATTSDGLPDRLLDNARRISGSETLTDDFSFVEVRF